MKQFDRPILTCVLLSGVAFASVADEAHFADVAPVIDGVADDSAWHKGVWYPMDQHILGSIPSKEDFSGRYTLSWDKDHLYLLAEIQDDLLVDSHADPRQAYWDDDCLEIFIDEDASGGLHQFDYNAFAYHVALDNQAADIGPDESPQAHPGDHTVVLLNDHIHSRWQRSETAPYPIIWEVAIKVFDDSFTLSDPGQPVALKEGKVMGFMLAYCDRDAGPGREHFMGSHPIAPKNGDKNLGYIDASVFDRLELRKNTSSNNHSAPNTDAPSSTKE